MRFVLPAVVGGHILLISAQVGTGRDATLLEAALFGAVAEIQGWVASAGGAVRGVVSGVADLRRARRENSALRADRDTLLLRLQEQRAFTHRTAELERLLQLRRSVRWRTVSARVIGADATPYFRTLTVDRGTRDGVRPDQAVISPAGAVGRIIEPSSRHAAKVQLLVDRNAGAGAYIPRTGAVGVVEGTGDPSILQMNYLVPRVQSVAVGDRVLTTGDDDIYPPGLPIGTVSTVEQGAGSTRTVRIAPAVDLAGLHHVLIVVPPREAEATASLIAGGGR